MPPPQQTSPLEVTVTPAQSSFFAGEELRCLITFTNRNIPIPASQPLPSTSRFPGSLDTSFAQDRRVISDADIQTAATPSRGHSKSFSFDVRSPSLRNGSQRRSSTGMGMAEDIEEESGDGVDYDIAGNLLPTRKRTIGKNALPFQDPNLSKATAERRHSKSASMALLFNSAATSSGGQGSMLDARRRLSVGMGYPSSSVSKLDAASPSRPRSVSAASDTASPTGNTRRTSTAIQADHPHSRKKSLIQVQHEDLSAAFELSNGPGSPLHPGRDVRAASYDDTSIPGAYQMSPSLSTDTTEPEVSFYNLGRNDTMESVVRDQLTHWSRGGAPPSRRTSHSSVSGTPSIPSSISVSSPLFPRPGNSAPGTETVLWSFAQFSGFYEVDESLIKPGEFEDVKRRLAFGDALSSANTSGTPRAIGGGDLGHEDTSDLAVATSWASYLRNALGGAGVGSPASSRHRRTGSTMLEVRQKTMASKTIPTFSSPPSIVAVDLNLSSGESKTYSFTMRLPTDLPPSYFGKAIKFTYELVIGTNRVDSRKMAAKAGNQRSRLIKIPLRVYNNVNIAGVRPFFDLTNPVVLLRDIAVVREEENSGKLQDRKRGGEMMARRVSVDSAYGRGKQEAADRSRRDLQQYARSLLGSCHGEEDESCDSAALETGVQSLLASSPPSFRLSDGGRDFHGSASMQRRSSTLSATGDDDVSDTCKGAIEVLTRNSQKVSYDISKDGEIAAVLTLVKSKYRLGDSILGVVTINRAGAVARVVRIAAVLESYEEIEATLGTMSAGRLQRATRRVHAEHHDTTLDAGQASFSLPIPSGATPDFSTSGVKLHWTVRLSFLTQVSEHVIQTARRPVPPPHLYPCSDDDGFSLYHSRYRAIPRLSGSLGPYLGANDGDEDQGLEGEKADPMRFGKDAKLEIVECAVPVSVLPNSTSFKPSPVTFAA